MKTALEAIKEHNSNVNQEIKRDFVGKHVYNRCNTLVEFVLNNEGSNAPFNWDDVENLNAYPEYRGEYAAFEGGGESERDEEIERLKEEIERINEETIDSFDDDDSIETIESEIQDLENLEIESREVYEWWFVSDWLYSKLRALGYVVIDAPDGYIWGRSTTGQAILLDHVIGQICADMEILQGQANSWEPKPRPTETIELFYDNNLTDDYQVDDHNYLLGDVDKTVASISIKSIKDHTAKGFTSYVNQSTALVLVRWLAANYLNNKPA